uniref:Uncharacterized protein n=1 Tax=Amphimedon queenslandica TaxID=400682 RepID=A0A1X7UX07_AMPQE
MNRWNSFLNQSSQKRQC